MLLVFLFNVYIDSFHLALHIANNQAKQFKKFYSRISKKHQTSIFVEGVL